MIVVMKKEKNQELTVKMRGESQLCDNKSLKNMQCPLKYSFPFEYEITH